MPKLSPVLAALSILFLVVSSGCLGSHQSSSQVPNAAAYVPSTDKPEFPAGWPLASIKLPDTATKYPVSPKEYNRVKEVHYSLGMHVVDAPDAYLVGFQSPQSWQEIRQFFDDEARAAGMEYRPEFSHEEDDPKSNALQGDIHWKKVIWESKDPPYELDLYYQQSKGNMLFPPYDGYYVVLRHL